MEEKIINGLFKLVEAAQQGNDIRIELWKAYILPSFFLVFFGIFSLLIFQPILIPDT
ncbi:MAG: hypothetical protein FWG65_13145 [Turicibacter sp.]|nr:hypothetical protein [Turicibacter sp.]